MEKLRKMIRDEILKLFESVCFVIIPSKIYVSTFDIHQLKFEKNLAEKTHDLELWPNTKELVNETNEANECENNKENRRKIFTFSLA